MTFEQPECHAINVHSTIDRIDARNVDAELHQLQRDDLPAGVAPAFAALFFLLSRYDEMFVPAAPVVRGNAV